MEVRQIFVNEHVEPILGKRLNQSVFLDKILGNRELDNAFVLPSKDPFVNQKCPGGIVSDLGEYIESSAWHEGRMASGYDFQKETSAVIHESVIYIGFLHDCWGHAITDNLKKLWFLNTSKGKDLIKSGCKLVYITVFNNDLPKYVLDLFELAGVPLDLLMRVKEITKFDKIYLPDNSLVYNQDEDVRYYTNDFKRTVQTITDKVEPKSIDKLYFTRTAIKNHRDIGENTLEKQFKKIGFDIVSPQNYSVREQIALLKGCKEFAATEGSISHNSIFCSPQTRVIILKKSDYINSYQIAIDQCCNTYPVYIEANKSTLVVSGLEWLGPFYLCVTPYLEEFLGHKVWSKSRFLDLSWYRYILTPSLKRVIRFIPILNKKYR